MLVDILSMSTPWILATWVLLLSISRHVTQTSIVSTWIEYNRYISNVNTLLNLRLLTWSWLQSLQISAINTRLTIICETSRWQRRTTINILQLYSRHWCWITQDTQSRCLCVMAYKDICTCPSVTYRRKHEVNKNEMAATKRSRTWGCCFLRGIWG